MEKLSVKEARELAGISKKEAADAIGISERSYQLKENKKAHFYVDEAIRLSEAINTPMDQIDFI